MVTDGEGGGKGVLNAVGDGVLEGGNPDVEGVGVGVGVGTNVGVGVNVVFGTVGV